MASDHLGYKLDEDESQERGNSIVVRDFLNNKFLVVDTEEAVIVDQVEFSPGDYRGESQGDAAEKLAAARNYADRRNRGYSVCCIVDTEGSDLPVEW